MLSALAGTPVPVPRVLCLCTDAAIAGTPFYVMEHVKVRSNHLLRDQHLLWLLALEDGLSCNQVHSCCALSLADKVCISHSLRYHRQWKAHAGCTWNRSASCHLFSI